MTNVDFDVIFDEKTDKMLVGCKLLVKVRIKI
jgi:hypothetical protein